MRFKITECFEEDPSHLKVLGFEHDLFNMDYAQSTTQTLEHNVRDNLYPNLRVIKSREI